MNTLFASPIYLTSSATEITTERDLAAALAKAEAAYVSGDFELAASLFGPLADDGVGKAAFYLGRMLETGRGMEADLLGAASWYRTAALLGIAEAQNNLARLYLTGSGVAKDEVAAEAWLLKAVSNGCGDAALGVAQLYAKPHGGGGPDLASALVYSVVARALGEAAGARNAVTLRALLSPESVREAERRADEIVSRMLAVDTRWTRVVAAA